MLSHLMFANTKLNAVRPSLLHLAAVAEIYFYSFAIYVGLFFCPFLSV
jgi:hypothetical protein